MYLIYLFIEINIAIVIYHFPKTSVNCLHLPYTILGPSVATY